MTPATKRLPKRRGPSNKKPRNANRYRERNNRANGPEPETRIKLKPFDAITLGTSRPYLIKKLIPRTGLTVIWGAPKSGKSFLAFRLAMHVALGWDYRGRRVQQGPVVYCAFEGQGGIPARKEAFRLRYLTEHAEKVPFYLQDLTLDLVNQRGELIAEIQAMLGKTPPVLVELDTLNRSLRGSENSDQTWGPISMPPTPSARRSSAPWSSFTIAAWRATALGVIRASPARWTRNSRSSAILRKTSSSRCSG
jgi:hypothetical protein